MHKGIYNVYQIDTTFSVVEIMSVFILGIRCPTNAVYSMQVTACPADCMDRSPKCSGLPFSEGCTCKAGYFRSGHDCVPASQCGCYCPDRHYIPVSRYLS